MSQTEQDEPWYDAEDIAEWGEVMETALIFEKARAAGIVSNAEARRRRFREAVAELNDPLTRYQARADIAALVGVPRNPRRLPESAPVNLRPFSPDEIKEANERHRMVMSEHRTMGSTASAERIAAEMELRRAKAEKYTAGWDDAAAALHLERIRDHQAKMHAWNLGNCSGPEPIWPKEWGPM